MDTVTVKAFFSRDSVGSYELVVAESFVGPRAIKGASRVTFSDSAFGGVWFDTTEGSSNALRRRPPVSVARASGRLTSQRRQQGWAR